MIWSTQRPVETQLANSLASELHLHNHTPLSKTRRTYLSLSHAVNIKRRFGGGSALHEAEPGDFTVAGSSREASHWSEWENRARSHSLAVLSCSCFLQLSTLTMMPFIFLQFLLLLLTDVFFFFLGFISVSSTAKGGRWNIILPVLFPLLHVVSDKRNSTIASIRQYLFTALTTCMELGVPLKIALKLTVTSSSA